jgi:hypothetical protein
MLPRDMLFCAHNHLHLWLKMRQAARLLTRLMQEHMNASRKPPSLFMGDLVYVHKLDSKGGKFAHIWRGHDMQSRT